MRRSGLSRVYASLMVVASCMKASSASFLPVISALLVGGGALERLNKLPQTDQVSRAIQHVMRLADLFSRVRCHNYPAATKAPAR